MTDEHDELHGDQHDDQHDDLRDRLRSADPAASLPPADPSGVARLLEDTMTDEHTDESRYDGTRHRSPLTWVVAAAAVLAIGGGIALAVSLGDDGRSETAGGEPTVGAPAGEPAGEDTEAGGEETVTDLSVGEPAGAKCVAPEPGNEQAVRVVAGQDTALDGTVESISGTAVTIVPSEFYAGEPTDKVVVQAPDADMQALLSAVSFEEGGRYLVSATDGRVTLCGFSAEYSEPLAELYAEAFRR